MSSMAAILWALLLGYCDLRYRRLPNVLTFGAAAAALAVWAASGASPLGATGASMLAGVLLALTFTLPGYLTGKLGAGDVKLLAAIGLLGGTAATMASFVIGALFAGAAAIAWLWLGPRFGLAPAAGRRLPFGAALAAGFIAAVVDNHVGGTAWPY